MRSNQVLWRVRTSNDPYLELSRIKLKSSSKDLRDFFLAAGKDPAVSPLLFKGAYPQNYSEVKTAPFTIEVDIERELLWELCLLRLKSADLTFFVEHEEAFQRAIILGDRSGAQSAIIEIQKKFGYSLWLMQAQLLAYSVFGDNGAYQKYLTEITKNKAVQPVVRFIAKYFGVRTDRDTTANQYLTHLETAISSQQDLPDGYKAYLWYELARFSYDPGGFLSNIAFYNQDSSLIDRFTSLKNLLVEVVIRKEKIGEQTKIILSSLAKSTKCRVLARICALTGATGWPEVSATDAALQGAISDYTAGDYLSAENKTHELILLNPACISAYALMGKISLFSTQLNLSNFSSFQKNLVEKFQSFEARTADPEEAGKELLKAALMYDRVYSGNELAYFVGSLHLDPARIDIREDLVRFKILATSAANPYLLSDLTDNQKGGWLKIYAPGFKKPGAIELMSLASGSSDKYSSSELEGSIPTTRINRYLARNLIDSSNYLEAVQILEPLLDAEDIVVRNDARELHTRALILLRDTVRAVDEVGRYCVSYPHQQRMQPVASVVELAIENQDSVSRSIYWPILCDIDYKLGNRQESSVREMVLEAFVKKYGYRKVSEILDAIETWPREALIYLLANVAIPDTLAPTGFYESSRAVDDERMRICRALTELDTKNGLIYQEEIKRITEARMLQDAIQQYERTRIRVDEDGVKREIGKSLEEDYKWYLRVRKESAAEFTKQLLDVVESTETDVGGTEKVKLILFNDDSLPILQRLMERIRDRFVSSDEYGLDGYLSVGIRHGTLIGKLRAPVAAHKLATQHKYGTEEYLDNDYWRQLGLQENVQIDVLESLLDRLTSFSTEYDTVLNNLKDSLIQISTTSEQKGLFNYKVSTSDVQQLSHDINNELEYEEFIELVFKWLWKRTDANLAQIRSKLKDSVHADLIQSFNFLQKDVHKLVDQGNFLSALDRAINDARIDTGHVIPAVTDWFSRTEGAASEDIPLELPWKIAEQQIRNIHPASSFNINGTYGDPAKISGEYLRPICDIAFIAFDNAIKHSGLSEITINVNIKDKNQILEMTVQNGLNENIKINNLSKKIEELQRNMKTKVSRSGIRKEGGSGLLKVNKILQIDIGSGQLEMNAYKHGFVLTIKIPKGHLHVNPPN